jgi:hypothetical protein
MRPHLDGCPRGPWILAQPRNLARLFVVVVTQEGPACRCRDLADVDQADEVLADRWAAW